MTGFWRFWRRRELVDSRAVIPAGKNPAPFSDPIIKELERLIPQLPDAIIHDPYAGEGIKLGALCDRLGRTFSGVDLERWEGSDPRVRLDDSVDQQSYPTQPFIVTTSPTYCNGVNDNFKPSDTSRRLTYRVAAGHELHPNNTGRWSGRGSKTAEAEYWRITRACVRHWPDAALVNVKDSTRAGEIYPLVQLWTDLLIEYGYDVERVDVACPGWRFGANSQVRADTEAILIALRSP